MHTPGLKQTVYTNKIPTNEFDKWLMVEGERFSQLVLRLFHTELEAVFEEFNRGQDNDGRKMYAAMLDGLISKSSLWTTKSTIGVGRAFKKSFYG